MRSVGWGKKFDPPADPLVEEENIPDIRPLPGWAAKKKQDAIQSIIQQEIASAKGDPVKIQAIQNAWEIKQMQIKDEFVNGNINKGFQQEFHNWLLGKSPLNTVKNGTPWGAQRLVGPEINEYLRIFCEKKIDFQTKLTKLGLAPPYTIGEAYLYFKYLLCKQTPLDEEYLTDFNYWTNPSLFNNQNKNKNLNNTDPITNQPYQNAVKPEDMVPKNAMTAGDPGTVAFASTSVKPLFNTGTCVTDQPLKSEDSALSAPNTTKPTKTEIEVTEKNLAQEVPPLKEPKGKEEEISSSGPSPKEKTLEEKEERLKELEAKGGNITKEEMLEATNLIWDQKERADKETQRAQEEYLKNNPKIMIKKEAELKEGVLQTKKEEIFELQNLKEDWEEKKKVAEGSGGAFYDHEIANKNVQELEKQIKVKKSEMGEIKKEVTELKNTLPLEDLETQEKVRQNLASKMIQKFEQAKAAEVEMNEALALRNKHDPDHPEGRHGNYLEYETADKKYLKAMKKFNTLKKESVFLKDQYVEVDPNFAEYQKKKMKKFSQK